MKVGDLVRHRFEGHWDEVGVITEIVTSAGAHPGGMVSVLWCVENTHRNSRLYRARDLEAVNASR